VKRIQVTQGADTDPLLHNLALDADQVVGMPVEELGFRVFQAFSETSDPSLRADHLNWIGWAKEYGFPDRPDALAAIREAWQWIIGKGLILPDDRIASRTVITRAGNLALANGLGWLQAVARLNVELVPELSQKARPLFSSGDFELAVFAAMREVEIAVRSKAGLPDSDYGVDLMNKAFRVPKNPADPGGPLYRASNVGGEADAVLALYRGALGLFKNPSSHRHVPFTDPIEAADVLVLADLLMRLVKRL
jgi:uncharacterized protein (TIGR02391 family)